MTPAGSSHVRALSQLLSVWRFAKVWFLCPARELKLWVLSLLIVLRVLRAFLWEFLPFVRIREVFGPFFREILPVQKFGVGIFLLFVRALVPFAAGGSRLLLQALLSLSPTLQSSHLLPTFPPSFSSPPLPSLLPSSLSSPQSPSPASQSLHLLSSIVSSPLQAQFASLLGLRWRLQDLLPGLQICPFRPRALAGGVRSEVIAIRILSSGIARGRLFEILSVQDVIQALWGVSCQHGRIRIFEVRAIRCWGSFGGTGQEISRSWGMIGDLQFGKWGLWAGFRGILSELWMSLILR